MGQGAGNTGWGHRSRHQIDACAQRSWVDILCWHDVLPKVVMRVEPDEEFIKALDRELQIFNYFIERVMEKICATNELRIPPGKLALKAALCASLEIAP